MEFFWLVWNAFAAMGVGVIPVLFMTSAPYGKFARKGWGPLVSGKIAWIVQEFPCFFIAPYYIYTTPNIDLEAWILLSLLTIHYFHRSIIYGYLMSSASKSTIPVAISAIFFNLTNGYIQGSGLTQYDIPQTSIFLARFWVGVFIWFLGYYGNVVADQILRNLRKPGESEYKIPYGWIFKYVSSGNYFFESVEWLGWGIACQNWSGWLFFFLTVANLLPRSVAQHKWYLQNFKEYSALNRKAYIPFIL